MEEEGFTRTITGSDNIEFYLPPAEYNKSGNLTIEQVRTSASQAAKKTSKKYSILVTKGTRAWLNLEKVKKIKRDFFTKVSFSIYIMFYKIYLSFNNFSKYSTFSFSA